MEQINDRSVAQRTYIGRKTWKFWTIIFSVVTLVITISVLTWGYGFNGFLYIEMKKITINHYRNVVFKLNGDFEMSNTTTEVKSSVKEIQRDVISYYNEENHFEFVDSYNVESVKSSKNIIFAVSQQKGYFKDTRPDNTNKILSTTIFVYEINSKMLIDIIFHINDLVRMEDYK